MKKYLLTIFGEFKSNEICEEIAIALSPVVDSPNLKFQFTKGVLIFHFASEMDMSDIHEYWEMTSYDLYESFILFDLETNEGNDGIEMVLVPRNGVQYMDNTEDDEFVALLLNDIKKNLKPLTLDQLLDKIKNGGIESLTPFEKGTLDNYSKN